MNASVKGTQDSLGAPGIQVSGDGANVGLDTGAEIRAAVDRAAVPVLLMLLYQMSGDDRWLDERYRPTPFKGVAPRMSGGLPDEVQAEIRQAAVPVIAALLAGQEPCVAFETDDEMARAARFFLGQDLDKRFVSILREELSRRLSNSEPVTERPALDVPDGFRAAVIGLGISGLAAIHVLQQLGIPFVVFERAPEAGGVWFQNRYPGAGVDTPSHLYSFSFHYRDWERHYELRDDLHAYFNDVLDELGVRDQIRFETEVVSARYDDEAALWTVSTRGSDGRLDDHVANVVISGVGSLNQPRLPDLPDMERFTGLQFHSNRWPACDLNGKRVAVVGAGASSQQICPEIAPDVQRLSVVQRSPQWVAPFAQFRQPIDDAERLLLEHVPLYRAWNWVGLFWQHGDKIIDGLRVDPQWEHPERAVNARNDRAREFLTKYINEQLDGRPDLIEKSVPGYPPFGKRMLLDNGWYRMLKRENVDLLNDSVTRVTETGLLLASGEHLEVDVIIWATGFRATEFLSSLDVYGLEGRRLREEWDEDDPRAFLGVSVPHFPNLFLLGGPNSLPGSGSFMYVTEMQAEYIRDLLVQMLSHGYGALEATQQACDRYVDRVDAMHAQTIWCHRGFNTYYRNSKGRVIFIMPFLNVEYWEMLRHPNLGDFIAHEQALRPSGDQLPPGRDAASSQP
ncbi:NAD(P)/FAD-dependent oxidoreductase [Saccharomonospora sp. NPDC046836]|uniref:flavin-containing monooxygenase n=1 Tax=Saccharomonospora sp. NPDC046836 TaxID=3156921 RepID=UPI0033C60D40